MEREAAANYLICFLLKYTQIYLLGKLWRVRYDFSSQKPFFYVCTNE